MNISNPILAYLMNIITLKWVIIFFIAYFFIIWISLIVWVTKDISNRTDKLFLQVLSVLLVILLWPIWIFLYLIIRPSKTLFEQYYSEIDNNLECLASEIFEKIWKKWVKLIKCHKCKKEVLEDFKYCPYCRAKLK